MFLEQQGKQQFSISYTHSSWGLLTPNPQGPVPTSEGEGEIRTLAGSRCYRKGGGYSDKAKERVRFRSCGKGRKPRTMGLTGI